MTNASLDVLVIDDDDITAEMVARSLKKIGLTYRVVAAIDGQDGLDVLRGRDARKLEKPYLILLDLNMPRMNGFEFLDALRADPELRDSVVFVLTTSDADTDRSRAYQEMIAGYMIKSAIGPQFSKLSAFLQLFASTISFPK